MAHSDTSHLRLLLPRRSSKGGDLGSTPDRRAPLIRKLLHQLNVLVRCAGLYLDVELEGREWRNVSEPESGVEVDRQRESDPQAPKMDPRPWRPSWRTRPRSSTSP